MSGRHALLLAAALAAAGTLGTAATTARAGGGLGVPGVIAFQGFLTDELGEPIDASVRLDVAVYDVEAGGVALWSELHDSVLVTGGVFAIGLGSIQPFPPALFDGSDRFLGVAVDSAGELQRTPLLTTPYAFRAADAARLEGRLPDAFVRASGDTLSGALRLAGIEAVLSGATTEIVTDIDDVLLRRYRFAGGGGSWNGLRARLILVVNGAGIPNGGGPGTATVLLGGAPIAKLGLASGGGWPYAYHLDVTPRDGVTLDVAIRAHDAASPVHVRSLTLETYTAVEAPPPPPPPTLDAAYDGGGAGLGRTIVADAGPVVVADSGGAVVSGPLRVGDGTSRAILVIEGPQDTSFVDLGATGDLSVVLPDSAIASQEILDEPGFSLALRAGDGPVTGATVEMVDVLTTAITTPAAGYVVVEASAQARFSASTIGNLMAIQIDETAGGPIDAGHYFFVGWDTSSPAGETYLPVAVRRTYFKPAGTHTFRLEAMDQSAVGAKGLFNASVLARYVPSGYGAIQALVSGSEAGTFESSEAVVVEPQGPSGPAGVFERVDLRELEVRARAAREALESARRALLEALLGAHRAAPR